MKEVQASPKLKNCFRNRPTSPSVPYRTVCCSRALCPLKEPQMIRTILSRRIWATNYVPPLRRPPACRGDFYQVPYFT